MKRIACMAACAALAVGSEAQAVGGMAEVSIIDCDGWVPLSTYFHHGEYWVAGRPGARYAIEIRNRLGERLLAVTSVDGVNVISGETAGWDQVGYVFDPEQRTEITGWRKSDAEVAAFTFTRMPNSYAARTGRPANVGVIGVALFRERQPQPVYAPSVIGGAQRRLEVPPSPAPASAPAIPSEPQAGDRRVASNRQGATTQATTPAAAPSPAPIAATGPEPILIAPSDLSRTLDAAGQDAISSPPLRERVISPKLGTGHGAREASFVTHTEFTRMQLEPAEVVRIHYDSLENLVAMGIVERPHHPPVAPNANPFPASPGEQYVPDPPGGSVGEMR